MQRSRSGLYRHADKLILLLIGLFDPTAAARNLYLNGVDISTARNQQLEKVDIHINEHGDIFIIAPHYQVNEEDTYIPLSKYVQGLNLPTHMPSGTTTGSLANDKKLLPINQKREPQSGQIAKREDPPSEIKTVIQGEEAKNIDSDEGQDAPPEAPDVPEG